MGTPYNLVIMTVSSAFGTSTTVPLSAAATVNGVTYLSFAASGTTGGTVVDYSILDTGNSEIGTATYTSSNTTLTSRTPTKSTNAGAAISASSAALILATIRAESLTPFITAGQLLGTATNDSASAGNVGQVISASATSSDLNSAAVANITSIALTPGDWDVYGPFVGVGSGSPSVTSFQVSINTSSNANVNTVAQNYFIRGATFTDPVFAGTIGPFRVQIASGSTTTYFINTAVTYSGGGATFQVTGLLRARRTR